MKGQGQRAGKLKLEAPTTNCSQPIVFLVEGSVNCFLDSMVPEVRKP